MEVIANMDSMIEWASSVTRSFGVNTSLRYALCSSSEPTLDLEYMHCGLKFFLIVGFAHHIYDTFVYISRTSSNSSNASSSPSIFSCVEDEEGNGSLGSHSSPESSGVMPSEVIVSN